GLAATHESGHRSVQFNLRRLIRTIPCSGILMSTRRDAGYGNSTITLRFMNGISIAFVARRFTFWRSEFTAAAAWRCGRNILVRDAEYTDWTLSPLAKPTKTSRCKFS